MSIKREMLSALTQYISDNFSSKRGLIAALKYKLLYLFGFYRVYQHIDFNTVSRLVFVCSGNICRSPFGEYIAKAKGLNAVSYGLQCRGGDKADPELYMKVVSEGLICKTISPGTSLNIS